MRAPSNPPDEMARLLDLHKLQILDTSPEERFDRITRIAQRVFGVDICLVSLVDTNRQWFKSRQGLESSETPRAISFCGHAILDEDVFVVGDTNTDERFADNPLVTESPYIRFYAGCPIRSSQGYRVGTLCVIDREPRQFTTEDQSMLVDLSALVEEELNSEPQAIIDEVSNVVNRRGFDSAARYLFNLCRRVQRDAQAVVLGINGLNENDDEQCQDVEDAHLRSLSKMVLQTFPTADLVARIAHDKFAVLICADSESTEIGLHQLRQLAADRTSDNNDELSWSVGCSTFDPLRHLTIDSLVDEADKLMRQNISGS